MDFSSLDFADLHQKLSYDSALVVVSGYDRSIADKDVKRALWKHFSECGDIILVDVKKGSYYGSSYSYSNIYFEGDIAEEKVMAMSGSDIGGWAVERVVPPPPPPLPPHRSHPMVEIAASSSKNTKKTKLKSKKSKLKFKLKSNKSKLKSNKKT
ncbi:unnamed protein product [Cochlearia groenlandica]